MQLFNHVQSRSFYSSWQEKVLPVLNRKRTITLIAVSIFALFTVYGLICRKTRLNKMRAELLNKNDQVTTHQDKAVHALKDQIVQNAHASAHPPTLKFGYMTIPFLEEKETQKLFQAVENFFSTPETYQEQFAIPDEKEIGYAQLTEKKWFVIRNQQKIPSELEIFMDYIPKVHAQALKILGDIESQMNFPPGKLTDMVSKTPLPEFAKATSVLRLFSYDPSEQNGLAADVHEDLGLLTITLCPSVPGLEVLDFTSDTPHWLALEKETTASQATVLVGETVSKITEGKYIAATHRVTKNPQRRFSIVYQLRAEPNAQIQDKEVEMTVEAWINKQKSFRTSVNSLY